MSDESAPGPDHQLPKVELFPIFDAGRAYFRMVISTVTINTAGTDDAEIQDILHFNTFADAAAYLNAYRPRVAD